MVLLIMLTEYIAFNHLNSVLYRNSIIEKIVSDAVGLNVITFDYLTQQSERAKMQWYMRHSSLAKFMEQVTNLNKKEQLLFDKIKRNHNDMKTIFPILIHSFEEKIKENSQELIERFANQLLIKSQNILTCAEQLHMIGHKELMKAQKDGQRVVLFTVISITIIAAVNLFLIKTSVIKPILNLRKSVEIIGKGNLKHKIDIITKDEIGDLAKKFNQMTKNLAYLTVSRDKLTKEMKERKKAEEKRKELEAQLQQQQKLESIGTLAGGIAHEINNPINGIMNYAQLIKDKLDNNSVIEEFTDEIIHETNRVATIVRNLLTFARQDIQSHSPALISDIIGATLSLIRTILRHDQILIQVNISESLPKVQCRSQHIQQVLMNLMINARDALNEKYPEYNENKKILINSMLLTRKGKQWIRISIEDYGTGIKPDIKDRIFDPFFTTKPREKGTGLGLSISYGIIKKHKGKLHWESELGKYTRFHLDLPVFNKLDDGETDGQNFSS